MLEKYERPFNVAERASLAAGLDRGPPSRRRMLRWLSIWLAIVAVGILILSCIALLFDGKPGWPALIGAVLAGVTFVACIIAGYCAYAVVAGYRRTVYYAANFAQKTAPQIRAALQDGRTSVCRVTSVGVIVIEEFEDEGSAFIYDLGDGTCLYLRGEGYYLDNVPGTSWPVRQFDLVRAAANDLWLGVFNRERRLEPELEVSMEEMPREYAWGDSPRSESVLPGRPSDVLSQLGYKSSE